MRHSYFANAFLVTSLLLAAASLKGETAPAASKAPAVPQATPEQSVSISPSRVPRGKSFKITFAVPPPGNPDVSVCLAGYLIATGKGNGGGTYDVTVPEKIDPKTVPCAVPQNPLIDPIPLGEYRISASYSGHWFPVENPINIVKADQQSPVLRQVKPEQISHKPGKEILTILGSNFIMNPASDNTIVVGGNPVSVKWDQCPAKPTDDPADGLHGVVKDPGRIDLCSVKLPPKIETTLQVKQGDLASNVINLRVVAWRNSSVFLFSFAIPILAIALVVFLASFLPDYKIHKTTYGMFSILFLDPETNTYSLSKYQFYLWTLAALFSYSYFALSRVLIQNGSLPDVPSSLPGIIAIGAGTSIGAQIITRSKGPKGGGPELPSLADFVTSGGATAPDRVQMFVWTNLGVLAFCLVTLHDAPWQIQDLPTIGEKLMYLMGISSAGYLGGKIARKAGPVLSEISVSPASPGPVPVTPPTVPAAAQAVLTQPITAAQQANRDIQAALSPIAATDAPAAFTAAQAALQALRTGIIAATTGGPAMLSTLADSASAADAASQSAAAEFAQVFSASDSDPRLDTLRLLAEQAQLAAAAAQDLATGVSLATAVIQAPPAQPDAAPAAATRVIELRGRNLSANATFEINGDDLPFRMLTKVGESRAPKIVAAEDDPNQPTFARELRLSIDPASLGDTDAQTYRKWFSAGVPSLNITITNPDGQQSQKTLLFPPGESGTHGAAA